MYCTNGNNNPFQPVPLLLGVKLLFGGPLLKGLTVYHDHTHTLPKNENAKIFLYSHHNYLYIKYLHLFAVFFLAFSIHFCYHSIILKRVINYRCFL